ncbi:hypothetical protein Hanom_Chr09g00813071 [Helianthus anomalus]
MSNSIGSPTMIFMSLFHNGTRGRLPNIYFSGITCKRNLFTSINLMTFGMTLLSWGRKESS